MLGGARPRRHQRDLTTPVGIGNGGRRRHAARAGRHEPARHEPTDPTVSRATRGLPDYTGYEPANTPTGGPPGPLAAVDHRQRLRHLPRPAVRDAAVRPRRSVQLLGRLAVQRAPARVQRPGEPELSPPGLRGAAGLGADDRPPEDGRGALRRQDLVVGLLGALRHGLAEHARGAVHTTSSPTPPSTPASRSGRRSAGTTRCAPSAIRYCGGPAGRGLGWAREGDGPDPGEPVAELPARGRPRIPPPRRRPSARPTPSRAASSSARTISAGPSTFPRGPRGSSLVTPLSRTSPSAGTPGRSSRRSAG